MTKTDLELLFEVIQTHRFMMASAFAGSVPNNKEMKSYMTKMSKLQDKIKVEMRKLSNDNSQDLG